MPPTRVARLTEKGVLSSLPFTTPPFALVRQMMPMLRPEALRLASLRQPSMVPPLLRQQMPPRSAKEEEMTPVGLAVRGVRMQSLRVPLLVIQKGENSFDSE